MEIYMLVKLHKKDYVSVSPGIIEIYKKEYKTRKLKEINYINFV